MADRRSSFLKAEDLPSRSGTSYPSAMAAVVAGREKRVLGDEFGLDQFGVNLTTLAPGAASSHRHWHECEDEFIYVLDGEIVLVDDAGEHRLPPACARASRLGLQTVIAWSTDPKLRLPIWKSAPARVKSAPPIPMWICRA